MPEGKYRSRRFRRRRLRLPGKRNVIHYSKRAVGKAHCNRCGVPLAGVPRVRDSKRRHLSKSKRRPNRPYGGNLCPSCLKARIQEKVLSPVE